MSPPSKAFATAAGMVRALLRSSIRTRSGGYGEGAGRWTSPGTQERPNGYLFNRTPPPPGQSREWEDWELPCYITSSSRQRCSISPARSTTRHLHPLVSVLRAAELDAKLCLQRLRIPPAPGLPHGGVVHALSIKSPNARSYMFVGAALIGINDARRVLDGFVEPDVVLWTSVVSSRIGIRSRQYRCFEEWWLGDLRCLSR